MFGLGSLPSQGMSEVFFSEHIGNLQHIEVLIAEMACNCYCLVPFQWTVQYPAFEPIYTACIKYSVYLYFLYIPI